MKSIFHYLYITLFFSSFTFSQGKIYLDSLWKTTTKEKAIYYRIAKKNGNLIKIKDYYSNKVIQFEGQAIDSTLGKEVFDGKAIWYNPNGKINSYVIYKNGEALEEKKYDNEGRIIFESKIDNEKNIILNRYAFKDISKGIYLNTKINYLNDKPLKQIDFENDLSHQRVETTTYEGYEEYKCFDKSGKLIATGRQTKEGNLIGTIVTYYLNPMSINLKTVYNENGIEEYHERYFSDEKIESILDFKEGVYKKFDREGNQSGSIKIKRGGKDGIYFIDGLYITEKFTNNQGTESYILEIAKFENEKLLESKEFYPNGDLKTLTKYSNIFNYDKSGELEYRMYFKDKKPFQGTMYDEENNVLLTYENGIKTVERYYLKDKKDIYFERILNDTNEYECNIYDKNHNLKYKIITKFIDSFNEEAKVICYENNKPTSEAILKNKEIESGKLSIIYELNRILIERNDDNITVKITENNGEVTTDDTSPINEKPFIIEEEYFLRVNSSKAILAKENDIEINKN